MTTQLEEQLKVFNWFYKLGEPLVSDMKYNQLFQELKRMNPESDVVKKTWSELGKPILELTKLGLLAKADAIEKTLESTSQSRFFLPEINMRYRELYYQETIDYFDQFIPKSIETIESVPDSSDWFNSLKGNKDVVILNFSKKADGFNISLYHYKGYYIGARTRGRSGTAEDVSLAMSRVVPMKIDVTETYARIKVEAVMDKSNLEVLRKLDPSREWKSPRNSIRTLLMNDIGEDFNRYIIPLAFKIDGKRFDSLENELLWFESQGFKVVENHTEEITSNSELLNIVKEFGAIENIYATDGCVVTVNKRDEYEQFDTQGKYDYAMRAYRLFNWQSDIYCSIILGIEPSYNSKRISLGLNIMPTKVAGGSTQTILDADNLSRIQFAQVNKGSIVAFHMRSGAIADWLDADTRIINACIKTKQPLPERLVQPVAELEERMREQFPERFKSFEESE